MNVRLATTHSFTFAIQKRCYFSSSKIAKIYNYNNRKKFKVVAKTAKRLCQPAFSALLRA